MLGLFVKRHAAILIDTYHVSVIYVSSSLTVKKEYEISSGIEDGIFTVRMVHPHIAIFPVLNECFKVYHFFRAHYLGFQEVKRKYGMPDLVHVNILTHVGIYAVFLKWKYKIPYFITEHWSR